jgi:tetratricopeptide (TPR) repeat protein
MAVDLQRTQEAAQSPVDHNKLWPQAERFHREGKLDEAIAIYRRILEGTDSDLPRAWMNLGVALRAQRKVDAAIVCYKRALELEPGNPNCLGNLGNALMDAGRVDEALAAHAAAVSARPTDVGIVCNYGLGLRRAGRTEAGLAMLERACRLDPQNAISQWNRALALLRLGRFEEGWPAFEWRWGVGKLQQQYTDAPRWWGERFEGKTLLIYPEQGFGDAILTTRFIPQAKKRGGEIVLICKPPLQRLFSQLPGVDRLVLVGRKVPSYDLQCPMMSLPAALGLDLRSLPPPPKLHVPPAAREKAAQLVQTDGDKLLVGVVWSGSVTFEANRFRSTSIERFLKLAAEDGVRVYSLQKGPREQDLDEAGARTVITDLGSKVDDFAETAAILERLDLVIMTDSAVAHLCGSLGRPVWNLLHSDPYWTYGGEGNTTPWYPTMRLFRQSSLGDWKSVFARVEKELQAAVTAKRAGRWPLSGAFSPSSFSVSAA